MLLSDSKCVPQSGNVWLLLWPFISMRSISVERVGPTGYQVSSEFNTRAPRVSYALTQWDFLADVDLFVRSSQMLLDLCFDAVGAIAVVHTRESPGFDVERP
jgi:hypothetical protein